MGGAPEIDLLSGRVRGTWRQGEAASFAAFLGIPYAQAPTGDLRFEAPVPAEPWPGVLDATAYGATPKVDRGAGATLIPEPAIAGDSTLSVNVFTPDTAGSLPVLVWIHGGGFTEGSPASPWYDGRSFVRDGVVLVTFSYRLGFEGFGFVPGAPHNRAVLDWLLALEWVQDNIAKLGGDPGRVTIAGQSAGGTAVLQLLAMPQAQALFSAAYASSPGRLGMSLQRAEKVGRALAGRAGVAFSREGFASIGRQQMAELESAISSAGLGAMRLMLTGGFFGPVIDGTLIRQHAVEGIAAGHGADKPLVIGANDDEMSGAVASAPRALSALPADLLLAVLGVPKAIRRGYLTANRAGGGNSALAVGRFITDRVFRSSVLATAEARGAAPTWVYRFAWGSPRHQLAGRDAAVHCLDVPFLFDVLDDPAVPALVGDAPPSSIAEDVHGAAVSLASTGAVPWPRWEEQRLAHVFDVTPLDEVGAYRSAAPLVASYRLR